MILDSNTTMPIVRIKNVSGDPYSVVELDGHTLADQEEIDLCRTTLQSGGQSLDRTFSSANRLVADCPTSKLWKDIDAGIILVTEKVDR